LDLLKRAWHKAAPSERKAFRKWQDDQETE
jgi:hypothetical protein